MTTYNSVFRLLLIPSVILLPAIAATPSSVQLAFSPNPSVYGSVVTLTATVTPATATGKVAFYDGTTVLGTATLNGGQASLTTTLLVPGTLTLTAFYGGDANDLPSTSSNFTETVSNTGDGGFATPPTVFGSFAAPRAVIVADFNRDGKADLAVPNYSGVAVLLGDGQGAFTQTLQLASGAAALAAAAGDFNGDGNTDLAVTNQNSTVTVWLGNGNGTFGTPTNIALPDSDPVSMVVGDFNGDGNADLVVVDSGNDRVDILLGNGDGTFQSAVSYAAGSTPTFVAVADLNGDGKTDLVVANNTGNDVSVLLGNGNGTFGAAVDYATGLNPDSIAVADFNGDGKLDLAVANMGGGLSLLIGNGDGTFQVAIGLTAGAEPFSITAFDFDGDGHADLAVADYSGGDLQVFLGNGNGTFQAPVVIPAGTNPNFVAVGDFNGDGRPDLVISDNTGEDVGVILGTPKNGTCIFALTVPSPQTLPYTGGTITASLQTAPTCAWEVFGLPNWITVTGPTTGMGPATISLVVAPNIAATTRSAEIDVANNPGLITQLSNVISVNANGVVNAANYSGTVAPGSIAAVFGNFLMAGPVSATTTPISTSLGGLTLDFGTTPAPLFYTSLLQTNIQVPWELAGQTQATVTSSFGGQTSVAETVNVATYAPGLFSMSDGAGQGAILDSGYQLVTGTNPTSAGSYIQIYCTGLGPVTNQPATGAAAPTTAPFAETTMTPVVTIGGVGATVVYSGLAPGTVGEYQINVQVPSGTATGIAVPVSVAIGGVSSNTVTIGVQ